MGRTITQLPGQFDPIALIKQKVFTCPICGSKAREKFYSYDYKWMDENGIHHKYRTKLNKYVWYQHHDLICEKCGCKWDTGWYPADYKMFEIQLDSDNSIEDSLSNMIKNLGLDLKLKTLSEEDLQEIKDRFGDYVRFVIEDMMSGDGKRWNMTTK